VAVLVLLAAVLINRGTWSVGNTAIGAALAVFIWIGASQSLKVAEVEGRLPQLRLASLLRPGLMVPWDISVAEALRRAWGSGARGLVVVDSAGRARGIVEESRITAVPPDRQAWTSIGDLARPLTDGLVLPVDLAGQELLDRMQRMPAPEYLVVHPDGTPAGILAGADVVAVLAGTPTRVTGAAPAGAAR
jgi:CBS domain-containing protein